MDTIEKALQRKERSNRRADDKEKSHDDEFPARVNKELSAINRLSDKSGEVSGGDSIQKVVSNENHSLKATKVNVKTPDNKSMPLERSDAHSELVSKEDHNLPIIISDGVLLAHRLIVPNEERSTLKEQYRYIKRSILDKAFNPNNSLKGKYRNLVMISSASPGEGKTYTALNLALSIALEQDRKILLIDADVVKPSISEMFNINEALGITDYLVDENIKFDQVLHKTNIANLTMVLSGKPHYLTNELLASDSMKHLVEELATRYPDRIVMFDTPPICHTTEAAIMASLVGQVIVVVEERKTTDRHLKQALKLLNNHDEVSLLMNKCHTSSEGNYYGYY